MKNRFEIEIGISNSISISNCEFEIKIFDLKNLITEFDQFKIGCSNFHSELPNSVGKSKFFDFAHPN